MSKCRSLGKSYFSRTQNCKSKNVPDCENFFIQSIENTKQCENYQECQNQNFDCDSCQNLLEKLYLAKSNMIPVIDEIINSASIFTSTDCKMRNKTTICSVSVEKFVGALKASKILEEVHTNLSKTNHLDDRFDFNLPNTDVIINTLCYADCAVNPEKLGPNDRVYINKDLMRQLIELHEFLGLTIHRLREAETVPISKTSPVQKPQKSQKPEKSEKPEISQKPQKIITSEVQSTVTIEKHAARHDHSCCSFSDHAPPPLKPAQEKKSHPVKKSQSDEKSGSLCCGCCKKKKKKTPLKKKQRQCQSVCCACNLVDEPRQSLTAVSENLDDDDDRCRQELERMQREYTTLSETLRALKGIASTHESCTELRKTIGNIEDEPAPSINEMPQRVHNMDKKSSIRTNKSGNTMTGTGSNRKITDINEAKQCIIDCLQHLSQVRQFLKDVNGLELDMQNNIELEGSPANKECCRIDGTNTHIHAKLNGVPVILKLNKVNL